MTALHKTTIIVTLLIGFIFRQYRLDSPVADWHSHRQADTASVSVNLSRNLNNFFVPTYHDLSDVQSGIDNPQGYRMVELPIYNLLSVIYHKVSGQNIDTSSRMVSIIFSLASALLIFLIALSHTKEFLPSYFSLLTFILLPYNIYYSRTILPEPVTVFFMLLCLYFFRYSAALSAVALSLSLLVKPYTAIIIFPALLWLSWQKYRFSINFKTILTLLLFSIISLTPFFLWRHWVANFPQGIPKNSWLLNDGTTTTFPNWFHGYDLTFLNKLVAFRPHWFYWLFKERLATLILGTFGIIPLFLGLAYKKKHTQIFSFTLIFGILLYFIIIAQGNIQHDYYQILIIPSLSMITGFGCYYLLRFVFTSKLLSFILLALIAIFSLYFSYDQIKGYYQINQPNIITAGSAAKKLLPANSLVVAPYTGDTAFLYQTGFNGWPIEIYDIDNLIKHFPDHPIYLVSVSFDKYTNSLVDRYPAIVRNSDYVILKLSP